MTGWIRKGVKLLEEEVGDGPQVERQQNYVLGIRITLSRGDVVEQPQFCLSHSMVGSAVLPDGFFQHDVRIDRECLVAGIFYAVESMNVGGFRKVAISPHLAYGETGVPGVIPPNAKLIVEIKTLRKMTGYGDAK